VLQAKFPEPERTGKFFAGTGNFFGLTGNFLWEQGIPPCRWQQAKLIDDLLNEKKRVEYVPATTI
jgi:hypothetical protein